MAGAGTSTHLAGELMKHMAKVQIEAVSYRGGAPALADLVAGQVPVSFNNIPEALGQVQTGAVRALGVTTAERSPVLPDVPTMAEAGIPGFDTAVWWGVLGPAGMAPDVVAKLHQDFTKALAMTVTKEKLAALGAVPVGNSPKEFDAFMRAEAVKWEPVIKAAGIKVE
jgi:tripartite-type tricarboxylate transporter receptor subunit TctC